jgi:sporulation protein YlmC with PRC-barrel domain
MKEVFDNKGDYVGRVIKDDGNSLILARWKGFFKWKRFRISKEFVIAEGDIIILKTPYFSDGYFKVKKDEK